MKPFWCREYITRVMVLILKRQSMVKSKTTSPSEAPHIALLLSIWS